MEPVETRCDPIDDHATIERLSGRIKKLHEDLKLLERTPEDQEVCNINQALSESYNERGFRYYQRVEFNLAMEDYSKSINFGSKSQCKEKANTLAAAYYNRGTVKYRMSHFSDASNDFINATQLRPDNVEFNKALTETLARIKEPS